MSRVISQRKVTKKTAACMHGPPAQSGLLPAYIFIKGNNCQVFLLWSFGRRNGDFAEYFACDILPFVSSGELGHNIRAVHLACSKLTASHRWCGCSLKSAR